MAKAPLMHWHVWDETLVMEGDRLVARFIRAEDAAQAVEDRRAMVKGIKRAGDTLKAVIAAIPGDVEFSAAEMVSNTRADRKEVYNAIGYLLRRGHLTKNGRGRYRAPGAALSRTGESHAE